MKLRAISLTNVRRFAGRTLTVRDLADGVNVIAEPNEFGKSTLFDALHALFFVAFGSKSTEIKALQPHAGGAVQVSCEIDHDGARWRLEKRWLSRAGARVTALPSGQVVAQDDPAEDWIARAIGQGAGAPGQGARGPAGLIWVRQGQAALEPDNRAASVLAQAARRDLISSVAGEIDQMTGGRRFDQVLAGVDAALADLVTAGGKARAGGPWQVVQVAQKAREAEIATLRGQVRDLTEALEARRVARARLAALTDPAAVAGRAAGLLAAQAAAREGEDHARQIAEAAREADLAALSLTQAQAALDRLTALARQAGQAEATLQKASAEEAEARASAGLAAAGLAEAEGRAQAAAAALAMLRARQTAADQQAGAKVAADRLQEMTARLTQARAARDRAEAATAEALSNPATPERLAALDRAALALATAEAARRAAAVTVEVRHLGAGRMLRGSEVLEDGALILTGPLRLTAPGLAEIVIDPGSGQGGPAEAKLAAARQAWQAALAVLAVADATAAHALGASRAQAEIAAGQAKAEMRALAPDGIAALHEEVARQTALAVAPGTPAEAPDPAELAQAALLAQRLAAAQAGAAAASGQARDRLARAETVAHLARRDAAAAAEARGAPEAAEAQRNLAAQALAGAERQQAVARARVAQVTAAAPDLDTLRAALARADGAVTAAARDEADLRERLARHDATIAARAEAGVEERLAEAEEDLIALSRREAALAAEVRAWTRLRAVLAQTRSAQRDRYLAPVQAELAPLLAILHRDAALSFDPDLLVPGHLTRDGRDEPVATLSGGTQEQIAILTRLAFARLLARSGRHVPVILDDALVQSDDDRIVRMFTALHRVAADQQILVLTCRQMAFAALGGHRPRLEIRDSGL